MFIMNGTCEWMNTERAGACEHTHRETHTGTQTHRIHNTPPSMQSNDTPGEAHTAQLGRLCQLQSPEHVEAEVSVGNLALLLGGLNHDPVSGATWSEVGPWGV